MRAELIRQTIKSLNYIGNRYEIVDTKLNEFLPRVQPSGTMTNYYAYRNGLGMRKRIKIGNHENITPLQARNTAKTYAANTCLGSNAVIDNTINIFKYTKLESI